MTDAQPLTRDAFLGHAGKPRDEETVHVPGMGSVLCRELSGTQRAKVLEVLAPAASGGKVDLGRYQQMLLQLGLVDPESPPDGRQPLLDIAGAQKAMELGAGKVQLIVGTIERLSGLDAGAAARAEGNSDSTQSDSATSE